MKTKLAGLAAAAALTLGSAYATRPPPPQVNTIRVTATTSTGTFAVAACPPSHPYLISGGAAAIGAPIWWNAPYTGNPYWNYTGPNPTNAWMAGADNTPNGNPPGYVIAYAICAT